MAGFFDKFLYTDGDKETKVKKEEPKVPVQVVEPLVTRITSQSNVVNPFVKNKIGDASQSLPPDELQKWQNYFNALLDSARKNNPLYNQFLENIDIVNEADPSQPVSTKVRMAYGMMKKVATKDQIVEAANNAIQGIVNDRKAAFEPKQDKRIKEGVTDNNKLIQQKQAEIQKMEEDIKTKNAEILQIEANIDNTNSTVAIRLGCYDLLSEQLLEKVKDDLTGITNYIN